MKKYLLMLACTCALLFSFTSCDETSADANDAIPYEQKSDRVFEHSITLKWYKGHRYLNYRSGHAGGIAHDPDCPRCAEKEKKTNKAADLQPDSNEDYYYDYSTATY